jgi:hypothetical protein
MKLFSSFSLASEKLSKYIIAIFAAKIMRIIKSAKRNFYADVQSEGKGVLFFG